MTDHSISGMDEKKHGKSTSISKIISTPFRSLSKSKSKSKLSKSSSSSNFLGRMFSNHSGKRSTESGRGILADEEESDMDNSVQLPNDLIHPGTEKTKNDEATETVNLEDPSPEIIDKKEIAPTKVVEKIEEETKEVLKPETNETVLENKETGKTPENEKEKKKKINDIVTRVQQRHRSLDVVDHGKINGDNNDDEKNKEVDHGIEKGVEKEKKNTNEQSDVTLKIDHDEEETYKQHEKKEQNCVVTLAQGLHSFCAPKND